MFRPKPPLFQRLRGCLCLALGLVTVMANPAIGPRLRSGKFTISDEDRAYWAFQPVRAPSIPATGDAHPVDALLAAKLLEKGLKRSESATPRELVRRAFFDLWGLPPAPEDVAAFAAEPTDEAWAKLIDRLLTSPHYGERWARHWLDLVRYAESNGYERDGDKPSAWRYRDYVIQAFNRDKPYDQFIREQLAGDEMAESMPPASEEWKDAIIATGYFRLHVWDDEPDSTVVAEYDDLDDIMVTTGATFMGLTLGCARCHHHKFDPLSQTDYYSLLSFLRSIDPYGLHKTGGFSRGTGKITRALVAPEEIARWEKEKQQRMSAAETALAGAADPAAKAAAEGKLKSIREEMPPFDTALCIAENGPQPVATHLLARGDAQSPREEVALAFPEVFDQPTPTVSPRSAGSASTGRRTVLADWIASPAHPLTARVMVNRIWQRHFHVGIVSTPDDFGHTGLPPSNQPLLDFLAAEFVKQGWSVKQMHRLIMTSRAYRMSSRTQDPRAVVVDQDNESLWRQNAHRVDAEVVRDSMLKASGLLNPKAGGPSVYPKLPPEVHSTQDAAGKGWKDSPVEEQNRRSIYLVVKRALKIPLLESLDFANCTSPVGLRPNTTTAPQALMLLNDAFVHQQAAALAARLRREAGDKPESQIQHAFQLVLQRLPQEKELQAAQQLILAQPDNTGLESFCRGVLNLNESIYVD